MADQNYKYVIVGGGLAGAAAAAAIRELDADAPILLIAAEEHLPYDRPPLTKALWFGKKQVRDIFLHDPTFYAQKHLELLQATRVVALDPGQKRITDEHGNTRRFDKLLLATGGTPKRLYIPGGDLRDICYYRTLDDYHRMRREVEGKSALIIGGGFIGSELAAALRTNNAEVTLIFPGRYLCQRVFPERLGFALGEHYEQRGIRIWASDEPVSITREGTRFLVHTRQGRQFRSDLVIVGIGIAPEIELATQAHLQTSDGIEVNEYLQTSHPDIYAAGDNARFPYTALGRRMRVEHWDNALNQGRQAGRNMAGVREAYAYMPYFFSDLFEFGYEAVGEVNSSLETLADWQKENDTGVVYYLGDGRVRGVMMCNVWEKVDWARDLIRRGQPISAEHMITVGT